MEVPTRLKFPDKSAVLNALLAFALTAFAWIQVTVPPVFFRVGGGPREHLGGPGAFFLRHPVTPLTYLLLAACFLPLAVRRRYPVAALGAVSVFAVLYDRLPNPPALTVVAVLIAMYTLATLVDRRRLLIWGGAFGAFTLVASVPVFSSSMFWAESVRILAMLVAAALLGDAERNRRAYVAAVEQRAVEAERTREEEARRRVDEERLRIARELHDIVAHSLSIVAVQSAAAAHVLDSNPEEARKSILAVREMSRSALQELRSMLGLLRDEGSTALPLAPAPGLAHLDDLVRPLGEAGLKVDVRVSGDLSGLPSFVDVTAYRIVQEALTNVLRHAGPASVTLSIARAEDHLTIEVADNGRGGAAPVGEGHGIVGMRERAGTLGGTFHAGPVQGGGWRVKAELPFEGRAS